MQTEHGKPRGAERRGEDRRKADDGSLPFPDRRKGERREGPERRSDP